ncbi:hypothetical protein FRC03_012206 [Tulasnella sp. 419]|nr:hypothetical protein FRC03_012206 [Tulasnella sp. 419]
MLFSSGVQSHSPTSSNQASVDQQPPASPLSSLFYSFKKRARAASSASRSRASSSARTRSRTASPEPSSVPLSPATSEEDLGLLDQDPFASYGCKTQGDLNVWPSRTSSYSPNNEIFDFSLAVNNALGAYEISRRDDTPVAGKERDQQDNKRKRKDSAATATEEEPDILPLHRRGRSLTTTVAHPRNQPWPSDRPAFRSRPSLPSLSVLTHQNIVVHAPKSSRARKFPIEPWDQEHKPLPTTPTTPEKDVYCSVVEVKEQVSPQITVDVVPELPREASPPHSALPPCPSPIQEESEEEIDLADSEPEEASELPYLDEEPTIRCNPHQPLSLLINASHSKHVSSQQSNSRDTLSSSLRIEVDLVHKSHEDSLSMPASYPPRHLPVSPTPSSCLLPSPRASRALSRSSASDLDCSGSEVELDSPGKETVWWTLTRQAPGPRTPPGSPRSPASPSLDDPLACAGQIENFRVEPTLTTVVGIKRAHSFPERSSLQNNNLPTMTRSATYSGHGDRQGASRQEGRSSSDRQMTRGRKSGDSTRGYTNGTGSRDDDNARRWNSRHSQRSTFSEEHVDGSDSEDSVSHYTESERSHPDAPVGTHRTSGLQLPGSTTSSRRGSRASPVPPVPPLPPHISSNNNLQPASTTRDRSKSINSRQTPNEAGVTAPVSSDETDDDVPLAQRIPTALTAQKSIRKAAREQRDVRSRLQRKQTAKGATENPANLADQLTSKLLKVQEQTVALQIDQPAPDTRSHTYSQRSRSRPSSPPRVDDSPTNFLPSDHISQTVQHASKYPPPAFHTQAPFPSAEQSKGVRPSRSLHRLHTESSKTTPAFDQPVPRRRQQSVGPRNERPAVSNDFVPPVPHRSATQSRRTSPDRSLFPKSPRLFANGTGDDGSHRNVAGGELVPPPIPGFGSRRPSNEALSAAPSPRIGGFNVNEQNLSRKSEDNLRRARSTRDNRDEYPQLPPSPMPPTNMQTRPSPTSHQPLSPQSRDETSHQQRVFIGDLQRFVTIEINSSTKAGDVVDMVTNQGEISGAGWMLWEMANEFGMERPIRDYEKLSAVFTSWNPEARLNALMLKQTPLSSALSLRNMPLSSPKFGGYVHWETKRGKWSKRWLELREHSLFVGKKENSKDEAFLCTLSSFDGYFIRRVYKAPKSFVFAVKSTDNVSIFENPADCAHIFSCDADTGSAWVEKILVARAYVLYQEQNVLSRSFNNSNNEGSSISRSGTRKATRPLLSDPNSLPILPPLNFQTTPGLFSEGSLLAKESAIA